MQRHLGSSQAPTAPSARRCCALSSAQLVPRPQPAPRPPLQLACAARAQARQQPHRPPPGAAAAAAAAVAGALSSSPAEAPRRQRQAAAAVRRMILLRHADSEASAKLRDYDRPISIQGRREAATIAKQLCALGWVPDLIIASNSKRTKQTLDTMAEASAELAHVDAHFLGSLYTVAALDGQTKHHLEEMIRSVACDAQHFCVMCVGHNKGWEEAASAFAKQAVRLSTASAALFEVVGASWEDVTAPDADWKLVQVLTPS